MGVPLSTDLGDPKAIPYFLWDEPMTVAEFKWRLVAASPAEQNRLLAKLLREARDTDVWNFISPAEVWRRSGLPLLHKQAAAEPSGNFCSTVGTARG